jgi:uncharacterized membrane protein
MTALPTKQSSVLGLPIGRRRTDWARVGRLGALGLGALSTAVGGIGAKRAGGQIKEKVSDQVQAGRQAMKKVGRVTDQASSLVGSSGDEGGGGDQGDQKVKKLRLIIKEAIEVGVPLETAYNQWTQFTEFPAIMKGPQNVEQESDDELRWVAKIGPSRRRWTANIVEQIPDERIVWESTDGTENRGVVTFHELDRNLTRVQVEMEYFPHGIVEKVGNLFLAARRRTRKDLRLYKHFLELAGAETGAWRGEILEGEDEAEDEGDEGDEGEDTTTDAREEGDGREEPARGRARRRRQTSEDDVEETDETVDETADDPSNA